jgi:hypothetical protein
LRWPSSRIVAGSMMTRTRVESSNTPIARPSPISLIVTTWAEANEPNVPTRISPAAVTTPAVCSRPVATASSLLRSAW